MGGRTPQRATPRVEERKRSKRATGRSPHDDLRDPRYVSACLAAMQSDPDAVLCCTDILFLDEGDLAIAVPPHVEGIRPTGKTPRDRLRQVARACNWYDVYGLARTSALRK